MAKAKPISSSSPSPSRRKALTPEAREGQLIALAIDLAEKQLMEGTASSQVITHYLKLGSSKERLEKEKLEKENELLRAKTESIQSMKTADDLYKKALSAFRKYSGEVPDDEEDPDVF